MQIGVVVPQGFMGEYDRWTSERAWSRSVTIARQAEALGFESIWLFDHLQTLRGPTDEITFESFTALAALAALTTRVRLGQLVLCAGYRNAALTAKMISTLDTISGGRVELGIGAGWKADEWDAYGFGFRPAPERMAILADSLEVIVRMLVPGRSRRASYQGRFASARDAVNVPKPIQQPRLPVMVGGNGPHVTWRLAGDLQTNSTSTVSPLPRLPVFLRPFTPDALRLTATRLHSPCQSTHRRFQVRSVQESSECPFSLPTGNLGSSAFSCSSAPLQQVTMHSRTSQKMPSRPAHSSMVIPPPHD